MMNNTLKYCLVLLIIRFAFPLTAMANLSEDPQLKPSELVRQYMLNHPNENFVIQTDRDLYFSGTDLLFSVWSLDDQNLSPFSYSGLVYVELMDKDGESMAQQILKLEKNKASGRIILPEQMASGTFYLQAYTNLQRNYGEHLFGIKIIQVINPSKPPVMTLGGNQSIPVVSVFPEGQKLLYGITNKLVIKATFPNGIYTGLSDGYLIQEPDDTITDLEFLVPGMGYCSFYADPSYKYHLDLPGVGMIPLDIQDSGLTISLHEERNQLAIMVFGKGIPDTEKHYLVGKNRGQVFFERVLDQGLEEVKLPFSSLPGGLLEFSILDSCFEEYCQRLYYHDTPPESLSSNLVFKKTSFNKGEVIDLEILLPEDKKFELLSLSVRKDLFINQPLNQTFKYRVDLHPFLNDWDESAQLIPAVSAERVSGILDIYLITRKGSRFKWQDMFQAFPVKIDFFPEVDSKIVTGYGFNPVNSMRMRNEILVLFSVGKEASIISSITDNEGRFSFEYPVQQQGRSEIVVQAVGQKNRMEISLNWPFHQSFNAYQLDFFHFDTSRLEEYDKAYVQATLEKVYKLKDQPVPAKEERILAFYGEPDSHTHLGNYISMRNMEEVFKEIVFGVKVGTRKDEYSLQLYHREKYNLLGDNPLILFNGYPIQNNREVLGIPVSGVDFVDLVRQPYSIENQIFDGIINIVAKDKNLHLEIPPNAFKTTLEVTPLEYRFSWDRESHEARIPDLNPTLYWNPDLSFEGNTKHISFKAGDNPGRFQVLLRGIDSQGKVLEQIKYILIE
ncbi:hypothetical protein ACFLTU_09100 [Bacteroidota bacterium]